MIFLVRLQSVSSAPFLLGEGFFQYQIREVCRSVWISFDEIQGYWNYEGAIQVFPFEALLISTNADGEEKNIGKDYFSVYIEARRLSQAVATIEMALEMGWIPGGETQ